MLKDAGFGDLAFPLGVLALLGLVIFGAAVVRFSKKLRPAKTKVAA